ncbi:kinase-like protein [Aureobasidium pullulans]|uniref:non-specific serine/threonine protein kinase n=1 Tax=Aureobasidium pullulans TaxID=5580 RepID=A0A4S9CR85_AURPU|nr:kinase-like protein [Aureobasidium pullulans]
MPVTPNIQALRFFDKRPFSTRSRNERRSRAQPSPPQLSTPPPPPTAVQPEQTVHVVDCGSNDLNMQCQRSLSEPPQSRLNRLRRKTSKWFTNRRPVKDISSLDSSPTLDSPLSREANITANLRPALKPQVESEEDVQRLPRAVHFDGTLEYLEDKFNIVPPWGTCPQWVGIRSSLHYSPSDHAETLSDVYQTDTIIRRARRHPRRSALPAEYHNNSTTGSSVGSGDASCASPVSQISTRRTSLQTSGPESTKNFVIPEHTSSSSDASSASTTVIRHDAKPKLPSVSESFADALKRFPVDEKSPKVRPSKIETIEDISCLKIYLETFFNERYIEPRSERSIRRQRLYDHLDQSSLSVSEKEELIRQWEQSESTHLRRLRTLKSTSVVRHATKGTFNAGFQELRILGKGNFGQVKLVTDADHFLTEEPSPCSVDNAPCTTLVRRGSQDPRRMKDYYAMKVIRKAEQIRQCQEAHLRGERDFLVKAEGSQWIVPLIASFQDNTNLYLVMEFMIGGDFLQYLLRHDILSEEDTKFYMAEMILGIEETHKMGWMHRDVKPDNFLIHSSGHLKISDFGLAFDNHWSHFNDYYDTIHHSILTKYDINFKGDAHDERDRARTTRQRHRVRGHTRTGDLSLDMDNAYDIEQLLRTPSRMQKDRPVSIVGTRLYMAPEVVAGHSYDGRCDWWSLGCIIFECFYSRTPFFCGDKVKTANLIMNHRNTLRFPPGERLSHSGIAYPAPSETAINLMKLLLREQDRRLGSVAYTRRPYRYPRRHHSAPEPSLIAANDAEEIKAHPFFSTIHWDSLHRSRPPFVPEAVEDVAMYFEPEDNLINGIGTSYMSLRERADPKAKPWVNQQLMGPYYERWVAEQRAIEKFQMGFPRWTDRYFEACKKEYGDHWESFKRHRINETRNAKLRRGIDLDEEINQVFGMRGRVPRPKDIMLRDPRWKDRVLERRKVGAFLGYTYRSPRYIFPEVGKEKTPVFSRPTIIPVNDHDDHE